MYIGTKGNVVCIASCSVTSVAVDLYRSWFHHQAYHPLFESGNSPAMLLLWLLFSSTLASNDSHQNTDRPPVEHSQISSPRLSEYLISLEKSLLEGDDHEDSGHIPDASYYSAYDIPTSSSWPLLTPDHSYSSVPQSQQYTCYESTHGANASADGDMVDELLNQPGEVCFNIPYEEDLTMQTTDISGSADLQMYISSSSNATDRSHWPAFRASRWQHSISVDEVAYIHDRLTASWPKEISEQRAKKQVSNVAKWLDANPDMVKALAKGDEKAWQIVIGRSMPVVSKRVKSSSAYREGRVYMTTPIWLSRPIVSSKKLSIIQRLSRHWHGASETLVTSRLRQYTESFGKISSPEPLLEDDKMKFRIAADAIFCEGAPHGQRNVGASDDDLLHQYSEQYSVPVEGEEGRAAKIIKDPRVRSNAARYQTGQSWLESMRLDEIAKIHRAIKVHWIDKIDPRMWHAALIRANEILETDANLLDRVKRGDKSAAFIVAKECVKSRYMKETDSSHSGTHRLSPR